MIRMMRATHPGESILHDCLEPLGLSAAEGAEWLGVSQERLASVISGRAGVSPEMAIRLDKAFGGGAETWYRLQAAYNMSKVMERAGDIHVERVADGSLPRRNGGESEESETWEFSEFQSK